MAVLNRNSDPYWHEKYLMLMALGAHSFLKSELFDKVKEAQEQRVVLGVKGISHSPSAYRYWLKILRNHWVIAEYGGGLMLTPLGQWIVHSEVGTILDRDDFIVLICPECSKPGDLALLKPLPKTTTRTNAKGTLFMDVECLRCGFNEKGMPMPGNFDEKQFISFYNSAVMNMRQLMKMEAGGI